MHMLAAHNVRTTVQRPVGSNTNYSIVEKLSFSYHGVHAATLVWLLETRPSELDNPLRGQDTLALVKVCHITSSIAGAAACDRSWPTYSLSVHPTSELVGLGRRMLGIKECVQRVPLLQRSGYRSASRKDIPSTVAGFHVNRHPTLLHAMSNTVKRLESPTRRQYGLL